MPGRVPSEEEKSSTPYDYELVLQSKIQIVTAKCSELFGGTQTFVDQVVPYLLSGIAYLVVLWNLFHPLRTVLSQRFPGW